MAVKPENRFAKTLFSKLNSRIRFEKTNNPYRAGMPDYYMEGPSGILWVEVKWISEPWIKDLEASKICKTASWTKQRQWLSIAHGNNVNTAVIVGVSSGRDTKGYVLEYPYSFSFSNNQLLLPTDILTYIESKTYAPEFCKVESPNIRDARPQTSFDFFKPRDLAYSV